MKSESEVAQSCPTLRDPTELQPTRLLRPWDFPGKRTGVGCHCLLLKSYLHTIWSLKRVSWSQMMAQKDVPDTVPREGTGHHACDTDAGKGTDLRRMHFKLSTGTLSRDKECGRGMNGGSDAALYTLVYLDPKLRQNFMLKSLFRKEYGNVTNQLPQNICSAYT